MTNKKNTGKENSTTSIKEIAINTSLSAQILEYAYARAIEFQSIFEGRKDWARVAYQVKFLDKNRESVYVYIAYAKKDSRPLVTKTFFRVYSIVHSKDETVDGPSLEEKILGGDISDS